MNRWLIAVVVGLMAVGCAEGVEDPQPAPDPALPQKQAPTQTLSGDLQEEAPIAKERIGSPIPALPTLEQQPMPQW